MRTSAVVLFLALSLFRASGTFLYVDQNSTSPTPPYLNWNTAATNIQDAIDAAQNGDTVMVTNGNYKYGGAVMFGDLTNRVALYKPITVQSVNGPFYTAISGPGNPPGTTAVRCAWLTNGASLIGFTLTAGATRDSGDLPNLMSGGGAWCSSTNAIIANCMIISNAARYWGSGVYSGSVRNSWISSNTNLTSDGASHNSLLVNCTVVSNSAYGVVSDNCTNCIIYYNASGDISGSGKFFYCCTASSPSGISNITAAPQLFADGIHLTANSPCVGGGTNGVFGTDIFNNPWSNRPSMGCSEFIPQPVCLTPQIIINSPGKVLVGNVPFAGSPPFSFSWLKDGALLSDNGHFNSTQSSNLLVSPLALSDVGNYQLVVSNAFGAVTSPPVALVVHCVDAAGTGPIAPYSTWATAATNIQDAVNAASAGEVVLVTNGIYQYGGAVMSGDLTNRVAINKPVTVLSVNGPFFTTILGAGNPTPGPTAVRCAWLTNGASLIGFTLKAGATRASGDSINLLSGGGAWCSSSNATIANCMIVSNAAVNRGSGVYSGSVRNSWISANTNSSALSGASDNSVLVNCTVVSNLAYGVSIGSCTNCIIYYNAVGDAGSGNYSYCCTSSSVVGNNSITLAPRLFADGIHLTTNSPCVAAGTNVVFGTDIFGTPWSNRPSMGCAELSPQPVYLTPQIMITNNLAGVVVGAPFTGSPPFTFTWLKDGNRLSDNGHFSSTQSSNLLVSSPTLADVGNYQVVVSNAFGMVTSAPVSLVVRCVDAAGTNPIAPYTSWASAATNIQDALDAASTGEIVLVTNGVYSFGGRSMDGFITNRISITNSILVQSINGAAVTVITGQLDPLTTNGNAAIRCVYMVSNSVLNGFTLTGGATRFTNNTGLPRVQGGGVYCNTSNAYVSHCVIATNFAGLFGGGAYSVTLDHCTLINNRVFGTNSQGAGGGAYRCNLANCLILQNSIDSGIGGGTKACNLTNCAVIGNQSPQGGGGADSGALVNCTVIGNHNTSGNSFNGYAAVVNANVTNCIVVSNYVVTQQSATNYLDCTFGYSDSSPLPAGTQNINADPQLLPDNIHLAPTSPCIGIGSSAYISGTDTDGQAWKASPSIGCDEFYPAPIVTLQPLLKPDPGTHALVSSTAVAGQPPFTFFWYKDGSPVLEDAHHQNTSTAALRMANFDPTDAGVYQFIVSNSFGVATSQVSTTVIIHTVDVAGSNPVAPYSSWATAATNIQDAIDAASLGDIVLVTNGIYATGGKVVTGGQTNRVVLDKPVSVVSVNGFTSTTIQGAWDPISTNGPAAVRCAYVSDGAMLGGFTLFHGATLNSGSTNLTAGGGAYCPSTNGVVMNCCLTNNYAIYGGGLCSGNLYNSLVLQNHSSLYGGGAYYSSVNNCLVQFNYVNTTATQRGGGTFDGVTRNSIVVNNFTMSLPFNDDNYSSSSFPGPSGAQYFYSFTSPAKSGNGNINPPTNLQLLDRYHIAYSSVCRGAGNSAYTSGSDFDGEAWANPPSIGCDEVILSNLVGPISVSINPENTNIIVGHFAFFDTAISGRVATSALSFGDGPVVTNSTLATFNHLWTNTGNYTITLTVFNNDYPGGVTTNLPVFVQPLLPQQFQFAGLLTNGFNLQFQPQVGAFHSIQYTTNLAPPVSWHAIFSVSVNSNQLVTLVDPTVTNSARFYRIVTQ